MTKQQILNLLQEELEQATDDLIEAKHLVPNSSYEQGAHAALRRVIRLVTPVTSAITLH